MKKLMLPLLIAAVSALMGCSGGSAKGKMDDPKALIAVARDNIQKSQQYHKLTGDAKVSQAHLQSFIAVWLEECKVKGMVLEMQQDGDPACVLKKDPPAPQGPLSPTAAPVTTTGK